MTLISNTDISNDFNHNALAVTELHMFKKVCLYHHQIPVLHYYYIIMSQKDLAKLPLKTEVNN